MTVNVLTGDLPATSSYAKRSWLWLPSNDPTGMVQDTLTITLSKGKRPGGRIEVDSYDVSESTLMFHPGRTFLLLNLDDPHQPDIYECHLDGRLAFCSCVAGRVKHYPCKHMECLAAVLAEDGIEPPFPAALTTGTTGK